MSTYCRITGKSRGLPKPHYFPLLPPISPADAKRLCRITGKSYGLPTHHYIPVVTVVSKKRKIKCQVTGNSDGQAVHHFMPTGEDGAVRHSVLKSFRYVVPVVETNADLLELLGTKADVDDNSKFVYTVHEKQYGLVLPSRLEAAVRDGDIRDIMLAKDADRLVLKLRKGVSVEVDIREASVGDWELFEGEGPDQDIVIKRKRQRKANETANDWRRKIFEDKEKQADSEEERVNQFKTKKRLKVGKLGSVKENPVVCSWKNVSANNAVVRADAEFEEKVQKSILHAFGKQNLASFVSSGGGKPLMRQLPSPLKADAENVDLCNSLPGLIQQPVLLTDGVIGFRVASVVTPFQPNMAEVDVAVGAALNKLNGNKSTLQKILTKQNISLKKRASMLVQLEDIPAAVASIAQIMERGSCSAKHKVEQGIKFALKDVEKYVPGQFIASSSGEIFVPGNVVETATGPHFLPGFAVLAEDGATKFLPGCIVKDQDDKVGTFVAGQTVLTRDGEKFVQGQTVITKGGGGARFMPGQTVFATDGVKFVPGQVIEDQKNEGSYRFVPGQTIMTNEGAQFVPGQFVETSSGQIVFQAGQSVLNENFNWEFIQGQSFKTDDGDYIFVPGKEMINHDGRKQFVPGQVFIDENQVQRFIPGVTISDETGQLKFVPGLELETEDGIVFMEGVIAKYDDEEYSFVAGRVSANEKDDIEFKQAECSEELVFHDIISHVGVSINAINKVDDKGSSTVFGHMIQSSQGVEFYPGEAVGLPAGKVIPGRLVKNDEIRFIPGTMIDNKFIPGQFVTTDKEEKFIPGQVIETKDGPKFVPGQVLHTSSGSKFVPGQTMETDSGPKFIPGQIIETKSGPTFIPGQVISTEEEGSRFVPGQVVDTVEGPRFVPGRVVETGDGVTFIPGQIVETEDGLKFVAPDFEDDPEGGYQFTLQGFEVAQEELKMIQRNTIPHAYLVGQLAIDWKMLQQLSDAGMAVGRQIPVDIPDVDIKSSRVAEIACNIVSNLNMDASYSIQMNHILSNVLQIVLSNVPLPEEDELKDENLRKLIRLAGQCEYSVESPEFLNILGNAVENIIKMDVDHKQHTINALHAVTVDLAAKVREKQMGKILPSQAVQVARKVAHKLNLDGSSSIKMSHILSNIQQLKELNVAVCDEIMDSNLKTFLNLALDSGDTVEDEEYMKVLGKALENTMKVDFHNQSQNIDALESITNNLALKVRATKSNKVLSVPVIEMACQVAARLGVDPTYSINVGHILSNLQEIKRSNVSISSENITDEDCKRLLNVTMGCNCGVGEELLQILGDTIENIINKNMDKKLQKIDYLHKFTLGIVQQIQNNLSDEVSPSSKVAEAVCKVASKLKIEGLELIKINDIFLNLQEIKLSKVPIPAEKTADKSFSMLMNLVSECKFNPESEGSIETFTAALEKTLMTDLRQKLNIISTLHTLSANLADDIKQQENSENLPLSIVELICKMTEKFNIEPSYSKKIGKILANLQQIKQAKMPSPNGKIKDKNLKNLLNVVSELDANKSSVEVYKELGEALVNIFKVDPNKESTINTLLALTDDLALKARAQRIRVEPAPITEIAYKVANKLNISSLASIRIKNILSNLQKTQNLNAVVDEIQSESLKSLLKSVTQEKCSQSSEEFLLKLGCAVEDFLSKNPETVEKTIKILHNMTERLQADAKEKEVGQYLSLNIIENACQLAKNLNLAPVQSIKMGQILANLQQIKESKSTGALNLELKDENLKTLLDFAEKCEVEGCDVLQSLEKALENTIKIDPDCKLNTIDSLLNVTAELVSNSHEKLKNRHVSDMVCQISQKYKIDKPTAKKISKILSNMQQIKRSNVTILQNVDDQNLKNLLNLAFEFEEGKGDSEVLQSLGSALEMVIKTDVTHKLKTIDDLHLLAMEFADKAHLQQQTSASSAMLPQMASAVADELSVDSLHSIKISSIISNLQLIQQSGVNVPFKDIKDERLKGLLHVAMDSPQDNLVWHQTVSDALKDVVKEDIVHKFETISTLHTLTEDLVSKALEKQQSHILSVPYAEKACKIAKKMQLNVSNSVKLGQIMQNLQQIKKAKVGLTNDKVKDKNLKSLLKLANEFKDENSPEFMDAVSDALENMITINSDHKQRTINTLHSLTVDLASFVRDQQMRAIAALPIAEMAAQIADNVNANLESAIKINNILANVQQIKQLQSSISPDEIIDENLRILLSAASETGENFEGVECLQIVCDTLENIIKVDLDHKEQNINALHASAINLAAKLRAKKSNATLPLPVLEVACKVAEKLNIDPSYAIKMSNILSNALYMEESDIDNLKEEMKDENLKSILHIALECVNNSSDGNFVESLENNLECVIQSALDNKQQTISALHALTVNLTSKVRDKQTNKILSAPFFEKATKVASNLNVDPTYVVKMSNILSNLQQIKQSNVAIFNDEVADENLKKLLSVISGCENNKGEEQLAQMLGDALENVINDDPVHKLQHIDVLQALTAELVSNIASKQVSQTQSSPIAEVACKVANKLNVGPSHSIKMSHIISNLKQIKESHVAILDEINDPNLKKLVDVAMEVADDKDQAVLFQALGIALEDVICIDLDHKLQTIDNLHSLTVNLASNVSKRQSSKTLPLPVIEMACSVASKLDIDPSYSVKMGHILSNLQQIKLSKVPVLTAEISDNNLKALLNITLEFNDDDVDSMHFLQKIGNTLENNIIQEGEHKLQSINALYMLTTELSSKVFNAESGKIISLPVIETACHVASDLNVDPSHAIKLSQILSNLKQMSESKTQVLQEVVYNENLRTILATVAECKNMKEAEVLHKLGNSLKQTIGTDLYHKLETINALYEASEDLTAKLLHRQSKSLPPPMVIDLAGKVAKSLKLDSSNSVPISFILWNLQQMNSAYLSKILKIGVADEKFEALIKTALKFGEKRDSNFVNVVCDALQKIIGGNADEKIHTIKILCSLTTNLIAKMSDENSDSFSSPESKLAEAIVKSCKLDASDAALIENVFFNLQKIKESDLSNIFKNGVKDETLQKVLKLLLACEECNGKSETLATLSESLKHIISENVEDKNILTMLHATTANLVANFPKSSNCLMSPTVLAKLSESVVKKMKVEPSCATLIRHIIQKSQRIKRSDLKKVLSNGMKDENVSKILKIALEYDTDTSETAQMMSDIICNSIKGTKEQKESKINSLYVAMSNLSESLEGEKVHNASSAIVEAAAQLIQKLETSPSTSIQVVQILNNLYKIKKSNLPCILMKGVLDENIQIVLDLVAECDGQNSEVDQMISISKAVKNILKKDPKNELQKISVLHAITNDLASNICAEVKMSSSPFMAKISLGIVQKMKVDSSCVPIIEHILQNMQKMNKNDIKNILNNGIKDENLTEILKEVLECDADGINSVQVLGDILIKSVNGSKESKEHKLGALYVSINNVQTKHDLWPVDEKYTTLSSAAVTEVSVSLISHLNLNHTDSLQIVQILSNLQKIKNSSLPHLLRKGTVDKNLQTVLNLVSSADEFQSKVQQLKSIGDMLENTILSSPESKSQIIGILHAVVADVASIIQEQSNSSSPRVAKLSHNLAGKMNVNPNCAVLIQHILQNIQQIEKSDVSQILNSGLKNEHLRDILKVSQECRADTEEHVCILVDVLERTIKGASEQKEHAISLLYSSTFNILADVKDQPTLTSSVADIAAPLIAKLDLNPSSTRLMVSTLSNLQKLKKSDILNLLKKGTLDENVQLIIDVLHVSNDEQSESEQLKVMGSFLENILTRDSKGKLQMLNVLHAITSDLVSIVPVRSKIIPTAQVEKLSEVIVEQMNVDSSCVVFVEHVIQSVQQLQKSEMKKILNEENVDECLKEVLKVALKTNLSCPSAAQRLGETLLQKIIGTREEKEQKLHSLYAKVCQFESNLNADYSSTVIAEIASPLVANLGLNPSTSTLVIQTLKNLQKIQNSKWNSLLQKGVVDKNVQMVVDLISSNGEHQSEAEKLQSIGKLMENVISENPEQKLCTITALHATTAKLVLNISGNSEKILSTVVVKLSEKISNQLNLNSIDAVLVKQVLKNLLVVGKTDLKNIMKKGLKNENLDKLLKIIIQCDFNNDEAIPVISQVFEKFLKSSDGDKEKIISELYTSVCDILSSVSIQNSEHSLLVAEIAIPLIAKLNLNVSNLVPIIEMFSNLQQIKESHLVRQLQKGSMDENVQVLLDFISTLDDKNSRVEQVNSACDILEKISNQNPEHQSRIINTLHAITKDLATNVSNGALHASTEKAAVSVTKNMNLNPSMSILVGQILENVQKLDKSDLQNILNQGIMNETLLDLVKTAQKCDKSENCEEVAEKLAVILQKSVKGTTVQKEQMIDTLYINTINALSDLRGDVKNKTQDLSIIAIKLAKKLDLPTSNSAILGHLVSNLQQIRTSDLQNVLQNGKQDDDILMIADLISANDAVRNEAKLMRLIESALEEKLTGTREEKLRTINSLYAISVDIVSNKLHHKVNDLPPPFVAKIAGNLTKKTKMNRSNAPLVGQILWNLQKINKTDLQNILNKGVIDVDLEDLLKTLLSCNSGNEATQTLSEVLQAIIKRHPSREEERINFLYSSIVNLLIDSPKELADHIRSDEVMEIALNISKKINVDPSNAALIGSVFCNIQKIKELPLFTLLQRCEPDEINKVALNLVLDFGQCANNDEMWETFEKAIENSVAGNQQQKLETLNLLHIASIEMALNLRQKQVDNLPVCFTGQIASEVTKKINVDISNVPLIENILQNLQLVSKTDLKDILSSGVVDENLKILLEDSLNSSQKNSEEVTYFLAESLQKIINGSIDEKEEKINSLYASTFSLVSNIQKSQLNAIRPSRKVKVARALATVFEITPEKSKLIDQVLDNLLQIKELYSSGELKRAELDDNVQQVMDAFSEYDDEVCVEELPTVLGKVLENIICGKSQEKFDKLTILHAATTDTISRTRRQQLAYNPPRQVTLMAKDIIKKMNVDSSNSVVIERAIWNLEQLSTLEVKSILKKGVENEYLKVLLKVLVEENRDAGKITLTLGNAIQKIIKGNPEQKEQKIGELYSSTFQLLSKTQKGFLDEPSSVSTEIVILLSSRLKLDVSTSNLVAHILINFRKIKKSVLPSILHKGVIDENAQMVLNLIGACNDAEDEVEQTKSLSEALETLIRNHSDHKLSIISKLHATTLDFLPLVLREEIVKNHQPLLTSVSKTVVKKMNIDESKAVLVEKILSNLQEIGELGNKAVLQDIIANNELKKLVQVTFDFPSNAKHEKVIQILGDALQDAIKGNREQKENEINIFYAKTMALLSSFPDKSVCDTSQFDVAKIVNHIAKTLKLGSSNVALLGQILSNVQIIKRSRLSNILRKGVLDESLQPIVSLLLMTKENEGTYEELQSVGAALQKLFSQQPEKNLQILNSIHASTVDLVSHLQTDRSHNLIVPPPSVVDLGKTIAQKLKLDASHASLLSHTLWNIQQATKMNLNNILCQGILDDNFKKLFLVAFEADDDKTDAENIEAMAETLEHIVRGDAKEKTEKINSLYSTSVNFISDVDRGRTETFLPPMVVQTTDNLIQKLKVDPWHANLIGHVLYNLMKIKQLNVSIPLEVGLVNNNFKMVAELMSSCDENENDAKMLHSLSLALEKAVPDDEKRKLKLFNKLHAVSVGLILDVYRQQSGDAAPPIIAEIAGSVTEKLKLDPSAAKFVQHIMWNVQQLSEANVLSAQTNVVIDDNLKMLLEAALEVNNSKNSEVLIKKIGEKMQIAIKGNPKEKMQKIHEMYASSVSFSVHAHTQLTPNALPAAAVQVAYKVAQKLKIDPWHAKLIGHVLCNLKQIQQTMISPNVEKCILDENLQATIDLAVEFKSCSNESDILPAFGAALEKSIRGDADWKLQAINQLHASTVAVLSESRRQQVLNNPPPLVAETCSNVAKKLNLVRSSSVLLGHLLWNLQQIRKSDLQRIVQNSVVDESLQNLLTVALENYDKGSGELTQVLGDTMFNLLKNNLSQKGQKIDTLYAITINLLSNLNKGSFGEISSVAEAALKISSKLNVNESYSEKVTNILSNLKQIKRANVALFGDNCSDESLKLLLNLALEKNNGEEGRPSLEQMRNALESSILIDLERKLQTINTLHAKTANLASKVKEKQMKKFIPLTAIETACKVASKLNIDPLYSVKISGILANLQEIKQSNAPFIYQKITDDNLRKLLDWSLEGDDNKEGVELLQSLGHALEKTIKANMAHKLETIDNLHALTLDLTSKVREEQARKILPVSVIERACKVASKLQIDPAMSIKMSNILSNLLRIKQSFVLLREDEITDGNLKLLWKVASTCDDGPEGIKFFHTVGDLLENIIQTDLDRKQQIINSLHAATADLLSKIRYRRPNKTILLKNLIRNNIIVKDDVVEKLSSILIEDDLDVRTAFQHMSEENPEFIDKVLQNAASMLRYAPADEKKTADTLHRAIIKAAAETSELKVQKVLQKTESGDFHSLVGDAIGLAKALGLGDVVVMLNDILKDVKSIPILAKDPIVMEVLKRLTIMRQLAGKRPNFGCALHEMQSDPYAARNDPRLRQLVRESALLMVIPEESFVLRSSEDIPCSLLFGDNCLAVEDFVVRSRPGGCTFLILKRGIQMVVPREAARDVLTGKVAYTLLDENGIQYFKPLHVFNALNLPKVATNRFSNYGYSPRVPKPTRSASSSRASDDAKKNVLNGSCSSQEAIANKNANLMKNRIHGESSYNC